MFRSLGKALVAVVPAVQLGRLGLPMIVALFTLTVLSLAALCWVISDDGRSERLTMIIMARAGAVGRLASRTRPGRPARRKRRQAAAAAADPADGG
ncbi:MAG TPA: hypothetical protein VHW06_03380 [Streptosporangiaceae bacterium]|jgi:hypothetical protein|nr:hypothetical protein [Streptosporangiaceae bacterium]